MTLKLSSSLFSVFFSNTTVNKKRHTNRIRSLNALLIPVRPTRTSHVLILRDDGTLHTNCRFTEAIICFRSRVTPHPLRSEPALSWYQLPGPLSKGLQELRYARDEAQQDAICQWLQKESNCYGQEKSTRVVRWKKPVCKHRDYVEEKKEAFQQLCGEVLLKLRLSPTFRKYEIKKEISFYNFSL